MQELIQWIETQQRDPSYTYFRIRNNFDLLSKNKQKKMMCGFYQPGKLFDFFIRRRNGSASGMSLIDIVNNYSSLTLQEQKKLRRIDRRCMPNIPE